MESNNVIIFPKQNKRYISEELKIEDAQKNTELIKHFHIQETLSTITPMLFQQLEIAGFDLVSSDENDDVKDGAFIVESIRSILCKYHGLYHPFQQIAENVFSPDKEEIGALRIADSLNLELKKSETL